MDSGKKSQNCDELSVNNLPTTSSDLSSIINQYSSLLYNHRLAHSKTSDSTLKCNFSEENEANASNPGFENKRALENKNEINKSNDGSLKTHKRSTDDGLLLECLEDTKEPAPISNVEHINSLAEIVDDCSNVESKPGSSKFLKALGLSTISNDDSNNKIVKAEINEKSYEQRTKIVNNWLPVPNHVLKETHINDFVPITPNSPEQNDKRPYPIVVDELGSSSKNDVGQASSLGARNKKKYLPLEVTLPCAITLPGMLCQEDFVQETPLSSKSSQLSNLGILLDKHSSSIKQSQFVEFKIGRVSVITQETRKASNISSNDRCLKTSEKEDNHPILDEHTGIYLGSTQTTTKEDNDDLILNSCGNTEYTLINGNYSDSSLNKVSDNSNDSTNEEKSMNDLRLLLNVFDHPVKYNINAIRDPIRQCKRISSVHLGDYGKGDEIICKK